MKSAPITILLNATKLAFRSKNSSGKKAVVPSRRFRNGKKWNGSFLGNVPENAKTGKEQNFPRSGYAMFTVEPPLMATSVNQ